MGAECIHGDNCACAVATRHEWMAWYCNASEILKQREADLAASRQRIAELEQTLASREAALREFARRAEAWHADPYSSSGQLIDLANDIIDAAQEVGRG